VTSLGIKILGICGSYRKGGTEFAVKEALEGATEIDEDVETKYISLLGKRIAPCIHCDRCIKENSLCLVKDDFKDIQDEFLKADGYIIGSPVYNMGITPLLQSFLSRLRPVYLVYPGMFSNKVGGAIATGGCRNGGQEMAVLNILNAYFTYEILPCGGEMGDYSGAKLWSGDGSVEGGMKDELGLKGARRLGKRVAQTASLLKLGWEKATAEGRKIAVTDHWFGG
jgi:multimeric flavodoxin WrbA